MNPLSKTKSCMQVKPCEDAFACFVAKKVSIWTSLEELKGQVTHEAIPSHPERRKFCHKFTVQDFLIFWADELASQALSDATALFITPFLPHSQVDLVFHHTVTSGLTQAVRLQYMFDLLRRYWKYKLGIPAYMADSID